ncbi:MAG: sigma-70 family RNA polymerase sigma factor [Vicinamibacterales bacterium]
MADASDLAGTFETHRSRLRGVAYRMLGSADDAEDAVQEAWLRLSRTDDTTIDNLGGWLTTVVARVCLDMLRARRSRREDGPPDEERALTADAANADPERDAVLAESVGLALLVVLDRLSPAERLAFVLHDLFAVDFEEIARVLDRSPAAARQLASRARRRVRGTGDPAATGARVQRDVVGRFLAALKAGDMQGLLAVLDPDVVVRIDTPGGVREMRGARTWAEGATAFTAMARFVRAATVDGTAGLVFAPRGRLQRALRFTVVDGRITEVEIVSDRARLSTLEVTIPEEGPERG